MEKKFEMRKLAKFLGGNFFLEMIIVVIAVLIPFAIIIWYKTWLG
jgi:hypothetical protein